MSFIDTIEIKNFKSIHHQKIEGCRRVNVFIGYPNVGKSNILEAIGLYSFLQLEYNSFKFNEICRVKHFSELFFDRDTREAATVKLNNKIFSELIINQSNDLAVRLHNLIDFQGNIDNNTIFSATTNNKDFSFEISMEPRESNYKFIIGSVKKYEFDKNSTINEQKPRSLAIPYGNNIADVLLSNPDLRKDFVNILKKNGLRLVLGRDDENSIELQKELQDETVVPIPYHQIADTLRRLIFFKAAIHTNSDSVLLFEEPEAHMFPPYISKFTSDIIFDENKNQYFISTHSPFVLNDFMEELNDNELSIYTVDLKNGESIIKKLSDKEITEVYQYGIDLFFNLENFLKND